jgi:Tol biopolymer transport system component
MLTGEMLGPYRVLDKLGAGGMGEVYRARDTRLDREVAVKILPELFAGDPDRLMRFEREAKALAALNHPNIAHVYGVEHADATRALVMELVEGEDLAQQIAGGPLPLDQALAIARQVASGLEAAHEAGIIHRDLKPANIKVRADGAVKVLDFGLAKAVDPQVSRAAPDAAHSPTITSPALTQAGVLLGTAAYMAPEQARGKAVDRRADIWAFGCVLYEMLTGRMAFEGETITDTLAAIMTRELDLGALPAGTPPAVRRLLGRCLERDPKQRLRDIGEARIALEPSATALEPEPSLRPAPAAPSRKAIWIVLGLAAIAAAAAAPWLRGAPDAAPVRRFALGTPGDGAPFTAAIAPDGSAIAVIANDRVWLHRLDAYDAVELPGTDGAHAVFWAPDGRSIGYQGRGQLWRVDAAGGQPVAIGRVPQDFTFAGGAAWLPDDRIVFTTGGTGLLAMAVSGGQALPMLDIDPAQEADLHNVTALPGGRAVVFVSHVKPDAGSDWRIDVFTPEDSRRRHVHTGRGAIADPAYASGHLLFRQGADVWALPFSVDSLQATGEPFLLESNARAPSAAADGTVAMLSGGGRGTDLRLTWIDRDGKAVPALAQTMASAHYPRLSPDGRFAAVADADDGESDIWIVDLARGSDRRLTFERGRDTYPTWAPDGRSVVYQCMTPGEQPQPTICARRADGSGARIEVLPPPASEPSVSPDGRYLVFDRASDLWLVEIGSGGLAAPIAAEPRRFIAAERNQAGAVISPDGRFAAYQSSEAGTWTVYVSHFPSGEGKWQVTRGYAAWPRWSAAGDRLFVGDDLMRIVQVDVDSTTSFAAGPTNLRIRAGVSPGAAFDVSPDGTRFLVPRSPADIDRRPSIHIVQNWRRP